MSPGSIVTIAAASARASSSGVTTRPGFRCCPPSQPATSSSTPRVIIGGACSMPRRSSPQSVTVSAADSPLYSRSPFEKCPSASICVPTCAVISMRSTLAPASLVAPSARRRLIESRHDAQIDIRNGVWFGAMNGAPMPISWLTS